MKTLTENYLSLAAYNYKRAAFHAARGDLERAAKHLHNARAYDSNAMESK